MGGGALAVPPLQLPALLLWARAGRAPLRRTLATIAAFPGVAQGGRMPGPGAAGTGHSPSRSPPGLPRARDRAWEPCKAGPRGRCKVESKLGQAGSRSPVLSKDPHPLRDPRRLASIAPQSSLWLESRDSWRPSRLGREPREAPTRVQGPRVQTRLRREVTLLGGVKDSQAAYREGAGLG